MAKSFSYEQELAFFIVNFGFSKRDYLDLTDTEKAFIYKALEDDTVRKTTLVRDAVFNAVVNANRKKGKPFRKLWHKKAQKADAEVIRESIQLINEIEKKETGWIDKIYKANGLKPPERKQKGAINNG